MRRAFTREPEAETPLELTPLSVDAHPNYVTPQGHARLLARLADAEQRLALVPEHALDTLARRAHIGQEMRWLHARIESAIPIDPATQLAGQVGFGSTVELIDELGVHHCYRIVGVDEAEPDNGRVSWVSPLAKTLLGARVGDHVLWERPAGELELTVLAIDPRR